MQYTTIIIIFLVTAVFRYYLSKLIYDKLRDKISYGSLILNIIGCFTLGLLMVYASRSGSLLFNIENINSILITVFIGFTSFSYKAVSFLKNKLLIKAATNIFYNMFLGLVFLTLGNLIAQ